MLVMKKLQLKDTVEDLINRFPTKTNRAIAKETNCNEHTVGKYRKEIDLKYDSDFVSIIAGKFIHDFSYAKHYWLQQIDRLEELKKKDLQPMEILAIEKHQSELHEKVLFLASQGEVVEVMRIMRMGKIPMLESE